MRTLPATLKAYFDSIVPASPNLLTPTELFIQTALSCVGTHEEGGDNHGQTVELFQSVINRPVGQSWCLDFVQACLAYVEAVQGIQSPLPATELCLAFWDSGKGYCAVSPAKPGDIIIWRFGATIHGHTGIILGSDSLRYQTVEGNTSDSADIDRNGDGVYRKNRAKGGSKTFVEVGFLRPFA